MNTTEIITELRRQAEWMDMGSFSQATLLEAADIVEKADKWDKELEVCGNEKLDLICQRDELLTEIRDNEVNPQCEADKFLRNHKPSKLSKLETSLRGAEEMLTIASEEIKILTKENTEHVKTISLLLEQGETLAAQVAELREALTTIMMNAQKYSGWWSYETARVTLAKETK